MRLKLILSILFCFLISGVASGAGGFADTGNTAAITAYNSAVDYAMTGDMENALIYIDKALSLQPNFTLALITKGNIMISNGDFDEAKIAIDEASRLEPDDIMVLTSYAAYYVDSNPEKAIDYCNQVIDKDPSVIEVWIIMGTAYGSLGKFSEEIYASEEALKIDDKNEQALINLNYGRAGLNITDGNPQSPLMTVIPGIILSLFILKRES